jgi:hydroxyacylglutathione hydrolase
MESELAANPFLRGGDPAVAASASRHAGHALANPLEVFTTLRQWKDSF